ncbi:MAG TPA: dipeptidase [Bacilli bacterium]
MRVFDAHCDVLSKMFEQDVAFDDAAALDAALPRLISGNVQVQTFALFLPEEQSVPTFRKLIRLTDLFYERVASFPEIRVLRCREDLAALKKGEIGALLSLEGVGGLEGDFAYLRTLYRLGLRVVGLTWNFANWAADGVRETRQGGLTQKGRALIAECERLQLIVDVSHLTERGFWEVAELNARPFIASHSNVYELCAHPRNLNERQIKEIIRRDGRIGLTFVPYFLHESHQATIGTLLLHLDHICAMGGEHHVGFGSDFDGITEWTEGLRHAGDYQRLANALTKYFNQEQVEAFLYGNWRRFYENNLPSCGDSANLSKN